MKIGSAVLADPGGGGFNRRVMAHIAGQIAGLQTDGHEVVLVSSGAILAGRQLMGKSLSGNSIGDKQALAAIGQVELMRRWTSIFEWNEIGVAQVLLTGDDLNHRRRFLNARRTLGNLLQMGILPIVNENDTVVVEEIKLGDNDHLSAQVTNLIGADLLILLTEVEGVYTEDPRTNRDAQLVQEIEAVTPEIQRLAGGSGPAGRGGMATKVEAARQASLAGIPTVIASGRIPNVLPRILAGESIGTIVMPAAARLDSRKQWIAFSQPPVGRVTVDDGGMEAILYRGKSLLPSGIVGVDGRFEMGDLVELVSADGLVFARGITSYSASETGKISGAQSSQIESLLGYKTADSVIHRDHMVVDKDPRRTKP